VHAVRPGLGRAAASPSRSDAAPPPRAAYVRRARPCRTIRVPDSSLPAGVTGGTVLLMCPIARSIDQDVCLIEISVIFIPFFLNLCSRF
jgi:hypothetical protein